MPCCCCGQKLAQSWNEEENGGRFKLCLANRRNLNSVKFDWSARIISCFILLRLATAVSLSRKASLFLRNAQSAADAKAHYLLSNEANGPRHYGRNFQSPLVYSWLTTSLLASVYLTSLPCRSIFSLQAASFVIVVKGLDTACLASSSF